MVHMISKTRERRLGSGDPEWVNCRLLSNLTLEFSYFHHSVNGRTDMLLFFRTRIFTQSAKPPNQFLKFSPKTRVSLSNNHAMHMFTTHWFACRWKPSHFLLTPNSVVRVEIEPVCKTPLSSAPLFLEARKLAWFGSRLSLYSSRK